MFPTSLRFLWYETRNKYEIVSKSGSRPSWPFILTIFIAYMHIIFIIKVKIFVLIKWSHNSSWLYRQLSLKWFLLRKTHAFVHICSWIHTNNIPLKCRCPIKIRNLIRHVLLGAKFFVHNICWVTSISVDYVPSLNAMWGNNQVVKPCQCPQPVERGDFRIQAYP